MHKLSLFIFCILLVIPSLKVNSQKIQYNIDVETGAMTRLSIENDIRNMNWLQSVDRTQYKWVGKEYGWGLGSFCLNNDEEPTKWQTPLKMYMADSKWITEYEVKNVKIQVTRFYEGDDLLEEYVITNHNTQKVDLRNIGINTPFNDNYPDAATCYRARTNAHVWTGQNAAYVNAMHMSGNAPHLGLILTKGSIANYEIKERGRDKAISNTRGVIILNPENITLLPNESYTLAWRIFKHEGNVDFYKKITTYGSVVARSNKYVYEQGEQACVEFEHAGFLKDVTIKLNGTTIPYTQEGNRFIVQSQLNDLGEAVFEMFYENGKQTSVHCLVISDERELIRKRADFILKHQQMNNTKDPRYGAYMVYDNEGDSIFLNNIPNASSSDRDAGRERLGMGVLLAMLYQENRDGNVKKSLLKYANFVHKLQDKDYNTYSDTEHKGRNRNYNYSWVANFYFEMFHVTGEKQYLLDGYYTLKALYRNFGHGFYAIDMPTKGYTLLKENGFPEEAASLLDDFKQVGDTYLKNGYNYPTSEVNYEQSIVAPSITHLLRLYLITKEEKYLSGAKKQLPLLESFGGFQPSYHLNEISIRHWDGYWFGKREFWGDTFPHYWSTLTAVAYDLYAECTGEKSYKQRAENILRNNLCQFFEDGKASCAFIYPNKVNGEKAFFYDPYANDQDWALVYYLMINGESSLK